MRENLSVKNDFVGPCDSKSVCAGLVKEKLGVGGLHIAASFIPGAMCSVVSCVRDV